MITTRGDGGRRSLVAMRVSPSSDGRAPAWLREPVSRRFGFELAAAGRSPQRADGERGSLLGEVVYAHRWRVRRRL